jgi:hypothetical protein
MTDLEEGLRRYMVTVLMDMLSSILAATSYALFPCVKMMDYVLTCVMEAEQTINKVAM